MEGRREEKNTFAFDLRKNTERRLQNTAKLAVVTHHSLGASVRVIKALIRALEICALYLTVRVNASIARN